MYLYLCQCFILFEETTLVNIKPLTYYPQDLSPSQIENITWGVTLDDRLFIR